jgi:DNA polymerase-4
VIIRSPQFHDISRQKRLADPCCSAPGLLDAAMALIRANWNLSAPIRAITVTALNLIPADQAADQLDLFSDSEDHRRQERQEQLGKAMDAIRHRFGKHAIGPASNIGEEHAAREDMEEKRQ